MENEMQILIIKRTEPNQVAREVYNFYELGDAIIVNTTIFFDTIDDKHTAIISYY